MQTKTVALYGNLPNSVRASTATPSWLKSPDFEHFADAASDRNYPAM
jgi:hypothetical protein